MLDFVLHNWYLFAVALVSGGLLLRPMLVPGPGGRARVGTVEAVRLMNREKAVLIDVREPDEYAAGHVAGSRNVPLAQLEGSPALPKNKALPVLLVCGSGQRAARALPVLARLGFENARVLDGGIDGWRAANLPVEKAAQKSAA